MFRCKDCGNEENFYRDDFVDTEYVSWRRDEVRFFLDGDGCVQDSDTIQYGEDRDFDENDTGITDVYKVGDLTCERCGSNNIDTDYSDDSEDVEEFEGEEYI